MKVKQTEQKEIGKVKLSDTQELVVFLVDNEKVDVRVWTDAKNYRGPTKRGVGFYLFDDNRPEFRKLVNKVDKIYGEIA